MIRRAITVAALCLPLLTLVADGQGAPRPGPARRSQLEQQLRQRLWRVAQQRVGLTEDQMSRLQATTEKFDPRRRALVSEERQQRTILRTEILADTRADQGRVAAALDRLLQLQRARLDLQTEEQRAFASFMTPVQRARYAALQEQLRRRADDLRRQRADSGMRRRLR